MKEKDILDLIKEDEWMMDVLRAVKSLNLSDWMIGAGFVRGKVWDYLHGYKERTILPDVDVTYFDKYNLGQSLEGDYENRLFEKMSEVPWSIGNAVRLHKERGDPPYSSSAQSLEYWVETATAVGVYLDKDSRLIFLAPLGIDDLVNLVVRPNPLFLKGRLKERMGIYTKRQNKKKWKEKWPKLKIMDF